MVHDGGRESLRPARAAGRAPNAGLAIAALLFVANGCAVRSRGPATTASGDGAGRTIRDGVYTEDQSRRGAAIYLATCARCHRPELTGSEIVPALAGDAFLERWSRRTAGDLLEKMRTMPPFSTPDPPTRQEYADILAYILSRNRFPSGQDELAADFETLAMIRIGAGD